MHSVDLSTAWGKQSTRPSKYRACDSVMDSEIGIGYENPSSKVKQVTTNFEKDFLKTTRIVTHSTPSGHLANLLRHTPAEHHRTLWKNLPNSVNMCHIMSWSCVFITRALLRQVQHSPAPRHWFRFCCCKRRQHNLTPPKKNSAVALTRGHIDILTHLDTSWHLTGISKHVTTTARYCKSLPPSYTMAAGTSCWLNGTSPKGCKNEKGEGKKHKQKRVAVGSASRRLPVCTDKARCRADSTGSLEFLGIDPKQRRWSHRYWWGSLASRVTMCHAFFNNLII